MNRSRWPAPEYRIRVEFDAPLDFVFRWCTDYRSNDSVRAHERYDRWIVHRSARRVVYEDLWKERDGWRWRRYDVRLFPPDRWRADSVGNLRESRLDYRLSGLPGNRTRLELRMRRRPTGLHPRQPPRAELEGELRDLWGHLGRALVRDYRSSARRRGRSRPRH